MKRAGDVACMDEKTKYIQSFGENPEGNRQLGRRIRRCEDNIKTYIQTERWKIVEWINDAEDRENWRALVQTVTTRGFHRIPQGIVSFSKEFCFKELAGYFANGKLVSRKMPLTRCVKQGNIFDELISLTLLTYG
jgi:hypothetical protein